ncbi:lysozyme inhibitor LprI family protein [Iodobacter arcticus]|uniref:Lysozyme inhibitor LprI family protein n=1 Tax=Iodobacter arcticus TaxID=590593 RepID=A0ABW2R225_9NEIS
MRFIFTLACALIVAHAQAEPSPPAQTECDAANQVLIKTCLAKLAPQAEQDRLNAETAARAMMKNLDRATTRHEALPAFERASKAYRSYRQAHCAWIGKSFAGGSGAGIAEQACRIDLDRARAEELSRFYVQ